MLFIKLSKNSEGFVLIFVLLIFLLILTFGSAIASVTVSEFRILKNLSNSTKAFYLAEAGLAEAKKIIINSNYSAINNLSINKEIGEGDVNIKITRKADLYTIISVGKIGRARRTVEEIIRIVINPQLPKQVKLIRINWSEG
ncbi:hypothetical protein RDV78_06105 [Bacillota bacterium LX-D]|nr:hypothetical protein [Bacillota bacterium LX-D]